MAIPDHLSLKKINLGLQLISLLDMKGIFQFKPPLLAFELAWQFIQILAAMLVIVHSLPTVRGTGSLKHSENIEPFEQLKTIRVVLM